MLRQVCGEIEGANDSLVLYLSSLQLEDIPDTESLRSLPSELIECAAGLSVRPQCVSQLQQAMAKLASVSADVEASLQEIQEMLKVEERQEEEFSVVMGPRPKPLMAELERETQKYHAAHSMASESNLTLHTAMQLHVKNLKLLSQSIDDLASLIPTLDQLDEKTLSSLEDMRKIMLKVDEMRNQRNHLELELRTAVQNDDITGRIAAKGDNDNERMFEDELKKHDKVIGYIRQNISAQTSIVQAMTERNADYADARYNVDKVMKDREDTVGQLVASYHAYEDLLNKTTKGLEFYDKLDGNVSKLLDRVKGVVKVQAEERNQIMQSSEKKAAEARALSLSLIAGNDPKLNFKPEAPPQTPDNESKPAPSVVMPPTAAVPSMSTESKPRLGDYLSGGYKPPASTLPPPTGSPSRRPRLGDYLNDRKVKIPEDHMNPQHHAGILPTNHQQGYPQPLSVPSNSSMPNLHQPPTMQQPLQQFTQQPPSATIPIQHPSNQVQNSSTFPQHQQQSPVPSMPYSIYQSLPRQPQTQTQGNPQVSFPLRQEPHHHQVQDQGPGVPQQYQQQQKQQLPDQQNPGPYFPTSQPSQPQHSNNYHHPAPSSQFSQVHSQYQQPQQQHSTSVEIPQQPAAPRHHERSAVVHQHPIQTPLQQQQLQQPLPQMPHQQVTSQQQTPQEVKPQPHYVHYSTAQSQPSHTPTAATNVGIPSTEYQNQYIAVQQQPLQQPSPSYQHQQMIPNPSQQTAVPQHYYGTSAGMFRQLQQQLGANTTYHQPYVYPPQNTLQQPTDLGQVLSIPGMGMSKRDFKREPSNLALLSDLTTATADEAQVVEPAVPMPGTVRPANKPTANIEPMQQQTFQQDETNQVKEFPAASNPMEIKQVFTEIELHQKHQTIESFVGQLEGKGVDDLWKEVLLRVDTLQKKKETVSVAKLYPFDNRSPDILPFDYNRVMLKNSKDDYINASYIDAMEHKFIVTQCPLGKKQPDFWSMILENGVEVVICLASDKELSNSVYLPSELNIPYKVGDYSIVVQSLASKNGFFERVLVLHSDKMKQTKALMHLQLAASYNEMTFPYIALKMNELRKQQKVPNKPVLVHDVEGGDKTGCFLVLNSLVTDLGLVDGGHWPVVKTKVSELIAQRKGIFREKTIIKTIYLSLFNYLGKMIGKEDHVSQEPSAVANLRETDFVGVSVASLKAELQPVPAPPANSNLDQDVTDISQQTGDTPVKSNFSQIEDELTRRSPLQNIPADLSKLIDLKLDDGTSKKNKITKDDFKGPSKTIVPENDPSDPFSQLDPLWSMKK